MKRAGLRRFARLFFVLGFGLFVIRPAEGTSFSTDWSDLWFSPGQDGWGIQFVQRGKVIFATMYVYDPSGNPIWYTATLNPQGTAYNWSGDLYVTRGPWFGSGTYNPAFVSNRKVGTMSWLGQYVESGVLTYSVDGVPVTKNIQRFLIAYDDYSGTYDGVLYEDITNCFDSSNNGSGNGTTIFTVDQTGQNVRLRVLFEGQPIQTINGTLTQAGQFGTVTGTYTSSYGESGNMVLFEMNVQVNAFSFRFSTNGTNTGCQSTGYLSGIRRR